MALLLIPCSEVSSRISLRLGSKVNKKSGNDSHLRLSMTWRCSNLKKSNSTKYGSFLILMTKNH